MLLEYRTEKEKRETAVVIAGGILLVVQSLLVVCKASYRRSLLRVLGMARDRLWALMMARRCRAAVDDPVAAQVQHFMDQRRMTLAWNTLWAVSIFWPVIMVSIMANILTGTTRWMTPINDMVCVVVYLCVVGMLAHPRIFRTETFDVWYSVFMFFTCVAVSPMAINKEALPSMSAAMMVIRLFISCLCYRYRFLVPCNLVYVCTAIFSFVSQSTDCNQIALVTFASCECLAALGLIMVVSNLNSTLRDLAQKDVEARTARKEHMAATALLNTMSDAVVELDADLRIKEHSTKLADMLLHGPGRSLAGVKFEQLAASDADRQLFRDHMARAAEAQTMADAFHLKLCDSLRNRISVETFHVCSTGSGEGAHHLIGVREYGDNNAIRMPIPPVDATLGAILPADRTNASISVKFDAFTFQVSQCSEGFVERCGPCEVGSDFMRWLPEFSTPDPGLGSNAHSSPNNAHSTLMRHYTNCVNEFVHAEMDTMAVTFCNLEVRSPHGGAGAARVLSNCTLVLSFPNGSALGEVQVEAVFTQVRDREDTDDAVNSSRRQRPRSRSSHGSRSSGGNSAEGGAFGGHRHRSQNRRHGSRPNGSERGRIGNAMRVSV